MRILFFFSFLLLFMQFHAIAQDPASLLEEGRKLELKLKDEEALAKYKQVLVIQPTNQKAQLKCAEISCALGSRNSSIDAKVQLYKEGMQYARTAMKLDSNNAEANYIMAVVYGKFTEVEKKTDDLVDYVRLIKVYADKAIKLNPQFGRGYHVLGKWHLEVVTLSGLKKAALKVVFGGVGEGSIDSAIENMEKCKSLEPYYCLNFYDLARAYQFNKQYEKAIGLLEQLKKLPTRRQDDVLVKANGEQLLQQLQ